MDSNSVFNTSEQKNTRNNGDVRKIDDVDFC